MIGSKEFIEYADKANIPMNYRVWAYALWREAQNQVTQKTAHSNDYARCSKCEAEYEMEELHCLLCDSYLIRAK